MICNSFECVNDILQTLLPLRLSIMNALSFIPVTCINFVSFSLLDSALQDFRRLLNEDMELLVKLREMIIDWVHEGFQDFFRKLENQFLLLSGKKYFSEQDQNLGERMQGDKILPGLVLVLSQLSISIEQSVIPRITQARNCLIVKFYTTWLSNFCTIIYSKVALRTL